MQETTYRLVDWDFDFIWDFLLNGVWNLHFLVHWVRLWDLNWVGLVNWDLNFIRDFFDDLVWFGNINLLFNGVRHLLDHLIRLGNVFFNCVWDLLDYFIRFWDENFDWVRFVDMDLDFIRNFLDLCNKKKIVIL